VVDHDGAPVIAGHGHGVEDGNGDACGGADRLRLVVTQQHDPVGGDVVFPQDVVRAAGQAERQ